MNFILLHIENIISQYKGGVPLALFLKQFFKMHPQLGSRDRRAITQAVFTYYRCAGFLKEKKPVLHVIFRGLNICQVENNFLRASFQNEDFNIEESDGFSIASWIWKSKFSGRFSNGIDVDEWLQSLLIQPDLFIRIRQNTTLVKETLSHAAFDFKEIGANLTRDIDFVFYQQKGVCLSLKNGSKIDTVLAPEDYVVQDYASQCSMSVLSKYVSDRYSKQGRLAVWDVCSGAGGKSIYWKDKRPEDILLATDIRRTILRNLKERFSVYGIRHFEVMALDATSKKEAEKKVGSRIFDIVFCDVPCSGSGTWSRTPEQFFFFKPEALQIFYERQYKIALEASQFLKSGGLFAYITCSVFKEENENVVEKLLRHTSLKLKHQQLINGTGQKADSLFIAVFSKA